MESNVLDKQLEIENAIINKYPTLWNMKHRTIKNKPITFQSKTNPFAHRPWQEEILNDTHPNKVIKKSRQLGLSELAVCEVLWFLDTHDNVKVMYTFPTFSQMQDFSKTRVAPVIRESKYLRSKLGNDNSVSTKQIGTSYLFMRTAGDGSQGEGADIDMYCADEYDRMEENIETAFKESMQSSEYGWIRRWSTPTIPGYGIDREYEKSDQRHYLHKCDKCGEWQEITYDSIYQIKKDGYNEYTQEIEDGTYEFLCKKCKRPLNRWNKGEWVAKRPEFKDTRGYFISQLNAVHISADSIKRRELTYASKQLFYNYVLGESYVNTSIIINEDDVRRNIRIDKELNARSDDYVAMVAGIDWGEPTWALVLGLTKRNTLQVVACREFSRSDSIPLYDVKQVVSFLKPFNPNIIVADAGYGADKNIELYRQFPYTAYSCKWETITKPKSAINFIDQWNDSRRMVTVDKTSKMQRMLQAIKGNLIGFTNWNNPYTQVLAKHLKNVRIMDNERNGIIYQSATRVGGDHLACCLAYAMIGLDKITQYGLQISQGYKMETLDF